jgi:oxygen-independent coproporphyrinogen-3 oxidase
LRYKDDLLQALLKEIEMEREYLGGQPVETIYFGGGTPSILSVKEVETLLESLYKNFTVASGAEITLEANPDDITKEKLQAWKKAGINRLSIGVQSFFEEELQWMNRAHNAWQARESLELATSQFENITMDLIYGSPLLTDAMWKENVDAAISLGIPHLSCYALTVEEKTPLQKMIQLQQRLDVDNDKQARQFLLLMQWLREKGYEHNEESNFALEGYRSRHNSSYWKGASYLGLGPSAHSYNGIERRWNIANNQIYISSTREGQPKIETEVLSEQNKINEHIMISLRTKEGLDLDTIETHWGNAERKRIEILSAKYINAGYVIQDGAYTRLTDEGMLRADGIAADLFNETGLPA